MRYNLSIVKMTEAQYRLYWPGIWGFLSWFKNNVVTKPCHMNGSPAENILLWEGVVLRSFFLLPVHANRFPRWIDWRFAVVRNRHLLDIEPQLLDPYSAPCSKHTPYGEARCSHHGSHLVVVSRLIFHFSVGYFGGGGGLWVEKKRGRFMLVNGWNINL